MSTLNQTFNIVRGWAPHDSSAAFDETFKQHSSVPANDPLIEGDVVYVESDGTVARATGEDYGGAASVAALATLIAESNQLWLVVEGATDDNYSSLKQGSDGTSLTYVPWKVVCIRGSFMYKTTEFVTRSYSPGEPVTVVSGKVDRIPTDNVGFRQYGEVNAYDASNGVLTVSVS